MKPEQWQQVERLCGAALERESTQHALLFAKACTGDRLLSAEVEPLLTYGDQSGSFVEVLAMEWSFASLLQIQHHRKSRISQLARPFLTTASQRK